jgi:Helix-turn-helix domain
VTRLTEIRRSGNNHYTSAKLNLLKAARFDRTISAFDKLVLAAIADHMNNHSGQTWPVADETIALEIGSGRRSVIRSRKNLQTAGYLTWQRTRTSNVYAFNFAKAKSTLELLTALKKNALRRDSRVTSGVTPESPIPVISPVEEESPKVEVHERTLPLMRVVGGRR